MARGLYVGMVVSMLTVSGATSEARPSPIHRGADVRFTVGGTPAESTLTAEGVGVRVTKRVGPASVRIRIEVANDAIDIDARTDGVVRLARRGKSASLNMAARDAGMIATARRMTDGSPALKSFGALINALDKDQRAAAMSMLTSWALVNAIRGDDQQALAIARRLSAPPKGAFARASFTVREETPMACWEEYSVSVATYFAEFGACVDDYGWIPGMASVCAFEWIVKAELAWMWVIGCSGGIPV